MVHKIYGNEKLNPVITAIGAGIGAAALLLCLIAAAVAFGTGYLTIAILRYFSGKADVSNFAYYSWGLALFTFLLYLIIH